MPALPVPNPTPPSATWPVLMDASLNAQPVSPALSVFPAQPPSGVPVSAVCLATAQSPRQVSQGFGCTPTAAALDALDRCRNRKCQNERFKHDPNMGLEPLARRATLDFQLFEDAGALDECALTHCPTEFYAAHASICVPLDTLPAVRLPELPHNPEPWDTRILDAFARHQNSSGSDPVDQLGICAPTLPLTYPCTPDAFSPLGLLNVLNGSPLRLVDPVASPYVPKGVLTTTLRDAAAVGGAADPRLAHPAFMVRVQPRPVDSRALSLSTVNLYALATCAAVNGVTSGVGRYQATFPVGAACGRDSECRMGKCSVGRGCTLALKSQAFGYIGSHTVASVTAASNSASTAGFNSPQVIVLGVVGAVLATAILANMYAEYLQRNKTRVATAVAERVMRPALRVVNGKTLTTVQRELTLRPADARMLQRMGTRERIEAEVGGVEGVEGLPVYVPASGSETESDVSCPSSPHGDEAPVYLP